MYSLHAHTSTPSLIQIAYSPTNAGSSSVAHLCAPGNTFEARSTFPDAHTAEEYAESHAKVMRALNNLEIERFDYVIAKGAFWLYFLPLPPSPRR